MKNVYLLLALASIFLSCNDDIEPFEGASNYIGVWQLTAELNDPGDGSGKFQPTENEIVIIILADGSYISNIDLCRQSLRMPGSLKGTYDATKSVLIPTECSFNDVPYEIPFSIQGDEMILSFQCFESCLQKYTRVSKSNGTAN